jgi:hypothetical protein
MHDLSRDLAFWISIALRNDHGKRARKSFVSFLKSLSHNENNLPGGDVGGGARRRYGAHPTYQEIFR